MADSQEQRGEFGSEDETQVVPSAKGAPREIGRYLISDVLGEGAMGVVYKGFDPSVKRDVAIKTIRAELLAEDDSGEYLDRFTREAQAAGRLVHPNVVTVFEFGMHEGMPYLALEFIPGQELKTLIRSGPLGIETVQSIFSQILTGLGAAHGQGVVHRDIKPQNIFVMNNGVTKVGDFGIARVDAIGMTRTGAQLGTPSYMSPEQFFGAPADNRSDLYSACAVLYELLSGRKAFPGRTITEVMYAVLERDPPNLHHIVDSVPSSLAAVVQKGLAKKPEDRFQSAEAFKEAFEAACSGADVAELIDGFASFKSTDALTDTVLLTVSLGIASCHDDVMPLVERQLPAGLDRESIERVQASARRALGYDGLVRLARALRTDASQRVALLTVLRDLTKRPFDDVGALRLDSSLGRIARSPAAMSAGA